MRRAQARGLVGWVTCFVLGSAAFTFAAQQERFDLILRSGHVIDVRNGIDGIRDVGITGRRIVRVAPDLSKASAGQTIDLTGFYVTPGLIDLHTHLYAGTGIAALTGDQSVYPDGFSFRTGVTTMVDAGTAGWRNFDDFRRRVIDRARTRVLAFVNVSGGGMGPEGENSAVEMDWKKAADVARMHSDIVVGFKAAHYAEEGWLDIETALAAGQDAGLPVMVDFGWTAPGRNLKVLLGEKLRRGDIYTHCFSGHREELLDSGLLNPAMSAGRARGVLFDVGHGAGSFYWHIAVPALQQGFAPDTISTDLHTGSMNAGMKDLVTVMSKILNLSAGLKEVVGMATWSAAQTVKRPRLGHLGPGAEADVTVLALEEGDFGFLDSAGALRPGRLRLNPEMTLRAGRVVWDRNGRAGIPWRRFPYKKRGPPPR